MLALISIIDQCLAAHTSLCDLAKQELDEATQEFYNTNETNRGPISSNLLAHLQSLAYAILDTPIPLSRSNIELIASEREHFRTARKKNAISAKAMARLRAKRATG